MKTFLKKSARIIVMAAVPVLFMASCESDLMEPENAMPPKDTAQLPPGLTKK
ncbi:MAG: hypothetical protein RIG62_12340 [Cyclobacteriaceae bacterium]